MAEIELGGWDIAFAMRYGDVNTMVADMVAKDRAAGAQAGAAVFPSTVSLSSSDVLGNTTTINATGIPAWGLRIGGYGTKVVIGFDIPSATITFSGSQTKTVSNVKVGVNIIAKLETLTDGSIVIAKSDVPTPVSLTYDTSQSTGSLSNIDQASVNSPLIDWVNGLMPAFSKVITKVDASLGTNQADWDWLIPKKSQAIVSEPAGAALEDGMVIVRSMTTSDTPPAVGSLAGDVIPVGAAVGIAINPSLFLEKMVVGALYLLFDNATAADFKVSGKEITTAKTFVITNFHPDPNKIAQSDAVQATFSNFRVSLIGDHLEFSSNISFPWAAVIVSTDYRSQMKLSLSTIQATSATTGQTVEILLPEVTNTLVDALNTTISASASLNIGSIIAGVAVAVLGAVIGMASAAIGEDEAPGVADESTTGDVQLTQLNNLSRTPPPLTPAEDEDVMNTVQDAAAGETPPRYFGHTKGYWMKSVGVSSLGTFLGVGIGTIPVWLKAIQEGKAVEVNRDLRTFMQHALKVLALPKGTAEDYDLTSIGLNGTLVIGAKPKA